MKKLQTKPIEEWIAQGKKNNKQYLFFQGYCLDLSSFKHIHPGGPQVIKNYLFKDISNILFSVFPHNKLTTPKLLEQYRIGVLNQPPPQRTRKQGTILKQRKQQKQKQNSIYKKSVQFPSQIRKLASQKQRLQQIQNSTKRICKNRFTNSIAINGSHIDQKKSKRKKNINQDYLDALKGTKAQNKQMKVTRHKDEHQIQDQLKQKLNLQQFSSGQLPNSFNESTVNVSIKKYIKKSWGSIKDFIEDSIIQIKVPVLCVKMDRIW